MEIMSNICIFIVLISIAAIPILLIMSLVNVIRKRPAKKTLKLVLLCIGLIVLFSVVGALTMPNMEETRPDAGADHSDTSEKEPIADDTEDELVTELNEILELVGIDPQDAKEIEQIDDWANGARYSFPTHGTTARVYCNMDGTVYTLKVGVDIDLYQEGYEPWHIKNFLIDDDLKPQLMACAEDAVKACLNYPATADFHLLDWSFRREFDRYYVNSSVEAQNAFGVPSEMPFTAVFVVDEGSVLLIALQLDGERIVDKLDDYPLPERKQIEVQNEIGDEGEVRLVDGQSGEYGEKVQLDSYEYIWYHVPEGAYSVICNSKTCVLYVDKNEITRNPDGYVEMENVQTIKMSYGETKEVVVGADEHIFLTIYADVTLVPKE